MKNAISIFLTLVLMGMIVTIYMVYGKVIEEMLNAYFSPPPEVTLGKVNEYYRNVDFDFVQNTNYFIPDDMQDLLNIYYTVLNSGKTKFSFYCPKEYTTCLEDVKILANDQNTLSDINNYVHPYNSFAHIETEYDSLGRVNLTIKHAYTKKQIQEINEKIESLYTLLVSENNSEYKNIEIIHDYIIDHSKYDSERAEKDDSPYHSDTAYGPLFEGYATCGGYTDLMELYLEKMNIKSFKVSSEEHVWNAVYYNNEWLHLDITWDDPVVDDGSDHLTHNYFLIDTNRLHDMEPTQHIFNEEHYYELKKF